MSETPRERFDGNLAALRLLRSLPLGLIADSDQRATLLAYEGWADGRVRALGYDAVGTAKPELADYLASLGVDPGRLVSAGGLSAYFTPPAVAAGAWRVGLAALNRLPATVLEPAAGMGAFLTAAPPMQCHRIAVEPDPIFSRILGHCYPAWEVRSAPLELAGFCEPAFDLIVGNAPFGDWGVCDEHGPPSLRRRGLQAKVHDWFLLKSVSLLRPGGVCVMITHRSLLDRESTAAREWLAERCELVGTWRLPCELWSAQGAEPVSDMVAVRRTRARL